MGLFKALGKLCAKQVSRSYTDSQVNNASSKAYKQTGKEIQTARKRGEFIDASASYKRNKRNNIRLAYQRDKDREVFINDL